MKYFSRAVVLSLLLTASALAANKYVAAGAPPPDRAWAGPDYQAMSELIRSGKMATPTLADPDAAAILKRMWNTDNFKSYRNHLLPVTERLPGLLAMQSSVQALVSIYVKDLNRGAKVSRELVESMAFTLRSAVVMSELVDELMSTIPAEKREQAAGGLQQLRGAVATIFDGADVSLSERKVYTDADLSLLLTAMAETLPVIKRAFSPQQTVEMRGRLEKRKTEFQAPADLGALDKMIEALAAGAAKPAPKANGKARTI
ncbi:MAG TPA: hypothetical protein VM029_10325 [Opitutaceae bacterium]|nr:hypothetical protein [Opitutaceae bacterium]